MNEDLKLKPTPFIKWGAYSLILLFAYTLQTIPGLFAISSIKPVLILPVAVCICLYEGVLSSSIFSMIAGLLWDISSDKLFGFNAIIFILCGMFISLLCIYYLRTKLVNGILFVTVTALLQMGLDYLFYYAFWGYGDPVSILLYQLLPTVVYTIAITPLPFFLVRGIARRFNTITRI